MLVRRPLPWILFLTACLHVLGMARTPLPAQDGLKFIRFAREFQRQPWSDVVRACDQHPLYPFLISRIQPVVAVGFGESPQSWHVSAQLVSLAASLVMVALIYDWTNQFTSRRTAVWACLIFLSLPIPAQLGHDTLSDTLAWTFGLGALSLGTRWLQSGKRIAALGAGLTAGLGYLTRPEVTIVPIALLIVALLEVQRKSKAIHAEESAVTQVRFPRLWPVLVPHEPRTVFLRLAEVWLTFLVLVGGYTLVKGEVSEKLALRMATGIGPSHTSGSRIEPLNAHPLHIEIAPKEESESARSLSVLEAAGRMVQAMGEAMGWLGGVLAVVGMSWGRLRSSGRIASRLSIVFGFLFLTALFRHILILGYLSERHLLPFVLLCLPRVAMGMREVLVRFSSWRGWSQVRRCRARSAVVIGLLMVGLVLQAKPGHPSRWGHWSAGLWLATHAEVGEAVLDTRGWAGFMSGLHVYDPWHVKQALTDSRLSYIVVTRDELEAVSERAQGLRHLLNLGGDLAVSFPEQNGGRDASVHVYRFDPARLLEEATR